MSARSRWLDASHAPPATAYVSNTPGRSIAWRVNAERIVLLGWARAILLQLAHPLVAAGVFEHSNFRATPWATAARLHHTVRAMLALTFGDDSSRERTLDSIRAIHRRVHGVLSQTVGPYAAGHPYSAEDPTLVLWVHVTLVESVLLTYEQLVQPLPQPERNAYCHEARSVAISLGAREHDIPNTWVALQAYLDGQYASGAIAVGAEARELAGVVLSPPGTWLVAPATWLNRTVTVGLLPASIRERYGIRWTPRDERTFNRLVSSLRVARRALPNALVLWPEARRRL